MTQEEDLTQLAKQLEASGEISAEDAAEVDRIIQGLDSIVLSEQLEEETEETTIAATSGKPEEEMEGDIRAQLRDMKLPQKMKAAMFGNAVCRALLIGDANRLVQEAVLKNPQLQEREVVEYAKNKNLSDFVLRKIGSDKTWMKGYPIKLNLVSNPKTPVDVSLKWLRHLRVVDLKRVANSKGIPQVIATTAKKRIAEMQKK